MSDVAGTLKDADTKMSKAVEVAKEDFAAIRTGRAHPSIFNKIMVDYYGTMTPLSQLASFQVPEARMAIISPFDKGSMAAIEKGIRDSDLGVNPGNDGVVIRVSFPQLTEERRAQQDALLPGVENRLVVLVAATTENPSFSVIAPLLSRSMLITLVPLSDDELDDVLTSALAEQRGLAGIFSLEPEARQHVIRMAGGDARRALTSLEAAAGVVLDAQPAGCVSDETLPIALSQVEQAVAHAAVRYDRAGDQHYDVASALIKSMRGSDVDAALHYLARMLEAGEDPRFIARRIVIAASEDVGMADPTALQTAVAAMHAVAQIGMPEARIILAQAVVHNAIAPKSNSSYLAINAAIADIRAGKGGPVPAHLRGSGYAGATRLGHGEGYSYAHDDPAGVVAQQYLPDDLLADTDYYRPSDRGFEQTLSLRWARLKERIRAR